MRKNYLWFQFFRYAVIKNGLRLFYKKIILEGRENLPKDKPILFVPNHQNSFMDALLVGTNIKPIIYFLTRAKAFKNPVMAKFLRSLNNLPVYRVRDGLSSVKKNNAIFDECIQYLKRNDALLIFPEANHNLRRSIRPLSKGFTRIAFDAEIRENWKMGLQVIPVGVNYTEHRRSRNTVRVIFGEPIDMRTYKELFEKDEREATEDLKTRVSDSLKSIVMHVPNMDNYAVHKVVLEDLEHNSEMLTNPVIVNKNVEKVENAITPEILDTAESVTKITEKYSIEIKTIIGRKRSLFALLVLSPFYLFSWINNIIPYQPVRKLTTQIIKDHAFDISIKFVSGIFLFPIFWILISTTLIIAGVPKLFIGLYFVLSICTSVLFKDANLVLRDIKSKKRLRIFKQSSPDEYQTLVEGIKSLNEFRREVLN